MAPEGVLSPLPAMWVSWHGHWGTRNSLFEALLALKSSGVLMVLWLGPLCWSQGKGTLFWWWVAISAPLGLCWGEFVCW